MANPIPKIDENNNVLGETTIKEAKDNGWPRRVVRVVIVSPTKQDVLLQRRSMEVHSFPDHWETSASGHVDVGESELEAAVRETKEELGVELGLEEVAVNRYSDTDGEKFFNSIYIGVLDKDTPLNFDTHEVSEVRWFTIQEINDLLLHQPQQCTPGLKAVWQKFHAKLLA